MCPADRVVANAGADLCALEELCTPAAREFRIGAGAWPLRIVVVRVVDVVHGYVNRCPHAGHPLNLRPDDFLTPDGALLMCRSHGALFEPRTGACVGGPCPGTNLERVPLEVVAGRVRVAPAP